MKRLLILFFALPLLTNAQIVSIQDSSGYLFSVNPLTGVKTQLTIPQTSQSGKLLSTDGVRFSWLTGMTNPMTTQGDIIYGGASGTPTRLAAGTANQVLQTNGAGFAPTWVTLAGGGNALTSNPLSQFASTTSAQFMGVISDETGGSGVVVGSSSPTIDAPNLTNLTVTNNVLVGTQFVVSAGTTTTLTASSPYRTFISGSSAQTVKFPVGTTLRKGQEFYIDNNSSVAATIQDNGANTLFTVQPLHDAFFVIYDTTTTNGSWDLNAHANVDLANTWAASQTFATGTTAIAPLNIPVGVMKTTPATGDVLRGADGVFTGCVASLENGVIPSTQYSVVASDFTLSAALGVQSCFPTTGDVWTLAGSTLYEVEGSYTITTGTTTTKTTAMAFALGGSASINYINLQVNGYNSVPNTVATAQGTTAMTQVASTVITATATTAGVQFFFKGVISMNVGGTVTPQINFSANPGGTNLMKAGSYIRFTKLGANTFSTIGSVN